MKDFTSRHRFMAVVGLFALIAIAALMVLAGGHYDHGMGMMIADAGGALALKDLEPLQKALDKVTDDVKNLGEDLIKKAKAGATEEIDKVAKDLKEKTDQALSAQGTLREAVDKLQKAAEELQTRATDAEQKLAKLKDVRQGDPAREKSPGELFIENEDVQKAVKEGFRWRGRVRMDLKAITTVGMPGLIQADRVQNLLALPERRMTVRDLITPGRTSSNAVQFWQETGFTNNADVVSETIQKPESTITGELVTANVATIAHIMIAAKQVLDDAPALQSHIDGRLRYGLAYAEELQLLLGDGSGVNILGIVPQATAYAAAFQPEFMQRIDAIRLAILQSELALFPATGIVLNPTDWARIELTKDNDGRYIFATPQDLANLRLWSRPVVATPAMTVGQFLVGAFRLGAQIFDREDANVEVSTEDGDNFKKNLVTIRGEERLALAVYRPEAFIHGTFQTTT